MAAQSDGSIVVDTNVDSRGFERGSAELRQATEHLSRHVEQVGKKLQAAVSGYGKALASGNLKDIRNVAEGLRQAKEAAARFQTELQKFKGQTFRTDEYKEIQSNIDAAQKALDKLLDRQKRMDGIGVERSSKAYQNLAYDIQQAELRLKEVKFSMRDYLNDTEHSGEAPFSGADTAQFDAYSDKLRELEKATNDLSSRFSLLKSAAIRAGGEIAKMAGAAVLAGLRAMGEAASEAARNLTSMTSRAVTGGIRRLGAWLSNAAKSMTLFGRSAKRNNGIFKKSFTTILKYGLGIRSLYFLFNKIRKAIKEGFENLAKYSDGVNKSISQVLSSFTQFKNQFAASFAPIVNVAMPALAKFIDMLSEATFRAGELFAALNGQKTVIRANKVEEDYAASLEKEKEKKAALREETRAAIAEQSAYSDATDESAESLDEETEAAKNLERQLAGFDELNILKIKKEDESEQEDMFETVPIDFKIADLGERLKEMWNDADLTELGGEIGGKIKIALDKIPWPEIKQGAEKTGKRLATLLNGLIKAPKLGKSLGKAIADAINAAFAVLDGFVWSFDWKGLGNAIMDTVEAVCDNLDWTLINHALQGLAIGLADLLNTIFSRKEVWEKVGVTIGKAINAAVLFGLTFLERFDFKQAAEAITAGLNAAVATIRFENIGQMLGDLLGGALQFLHTSVREFDWEGLGNRIAVGVNAFTSTVRRKIYDIQWADMGAAVTDGINTAIIGVEWGGVGETAGMLLGGVLTAAASFIRELDYGEIVQAIQDFFSGALQQIDFYDILTVWGVAALIVALQKIVQKHPVLTLLTGAVLALGPELGNVIHRMVQDIPWEEVGQNLGRFLVNALNRLHEAIQSVNWFELGQAVGRFLGNINWSEIVNSVLKIIGDLIIAGFKTLGGIIVGMGPQGILNALWALVKVVSAYIGGKTLLTGLSGGINTLLRAVLFTVTSKINGLAVPIMGAISSLMSKVGAALTAGIPVIATAALAVFDAVAVVYDIKKLGEIQEAYVGELEAHNKETEIALNNFEKLYREKGPEVAAQWAKACYDIDVAGQGLEEAQKTLVDKIDSCWADTPDNFARYLYEGFTNGLNDYFGEGGKGLWQYCKDIFGGFIDFVRETPHKKR